MEGIDSEQASFLVGILLAQLINFHYRLARRWLKKGKRVFADLVAWDEAAARLARQASSGPFKARYAAVKALGDHVFARFGGPMPREWGTDWEAVVPISAATATVSAARYVEQSDRQD